MVDGAGSLPWAGKNSVYAHEPRWVLRARRRARQWRLGVRLSCLRFGFKSRASPIRVLEARRESFHAKTDVRISTYCSALGFCTVGMCHDVMQP